MKILGQFADAADLYLLADESSIKKVFKIIDRFCAKTGFKGNYDKTTLYRIGSLKASDVSKYVDKRIKWNVATINVLGVDMVETVSLKRHGFLQFMKSGSSSKV